MKTMDVNLFIRALAIISVVFNHAYIDRYYEAYGSVEDVFFGLSLAGGANVLLLISGFNFAEFIMSKSDVSSLKISLVGFAKKIAIPSLLLTVFFFVILSKFNIYELLFIRNFIDNDRISKFPIWYPQVMLQMLLVLYLILPLVFGFIQSKPWGLSLLFLMITISSAIIGIYTFELDMLKYKVPQLYAWVFVMGWVFYYAKVSESLSKKVFAFIILALSCILIIGPYDLNFYWLCSAGYLLVFYKTIIIGKFLKKILTIVAQATFIIFLFHRFFFEVLEKLSPFSYGYLTLFFFGIFASIILWASATSFSRIYKRNLESVG
ncbi:hypothetical protein PL71_13375 [Pseudoalteromonas distincta]|uniref:Acyltransferase family protein n=1 Tax=Pseudoalteromonas distincta TaxID=77608 RepID=A0ABT9GB51_9GAMM|nr:MULTISPECIES: acyltransferase family protein [Pseudoalteromonas]KHM46534.1 hypothetical protein PL71_13375 [Pseudoalteromonas elyakovii]KID34141.1 hypothetical protein QT16_18640 [Pseudoalteromonas distincta]MDP4483099.1 acyltransferase family protein [Pseudoalteromonas elyakovii]